MALYFRCVKPLLVAMCLVATSSVVVAAQNAEEVRTRAESGEAEAQYYLGVMYKTGDWVQKNDTEAARWYRLATDQGHADVQATLGNMYAMGVAIPENLDAALRYSRLAANQGNARGLSNLAGMYEIGLGVPQNDVMAYMYMNLAASRESRPAPRRIWGQARDEAAARLTPDQRAEGQRLALEWDAAHPRD